MDENRRLKLSVQRLQQSTDYYERKEKEEQRKKRLEDQEREEERRIKQKVRVEEEEREQVRKELKQRQSLDHELIALLNSKRPRY